MAQLACEMNVVARDGYARCGEVKLNHRGTTVLTPIFMPVGTQGTVKALLAQEQLGSELDCRILLGNTYHLGHRPGPERLRAMGGLHKAMRWNRGILTDSGGFQMVSLLSLSDVCEEGVRFRSPHDGTEQLLTPEASMLQQRAIGSDIAMALDDVVRPHTTAPARLREATERTVRWIDRCQTVIPRTDPTQALFGIVQGGLHNDLRSVCLDELVRRDLQGYAVGGLAGGEAKEDFWPVIAQCGAALPKNKPRYAMGIGYAEDMLICVAHGIDMFDCVFPTRTARFGTALVRDRNTPAGSIDLRNSKYTLDLSILDTECPCEACRGGISRAALHAMFTSGNKESIAIGSQLLTHHNVAHQLRLMKDARNAIMKGEYASFVTNYMVDRYGGDVESVPKWIVSALAAAGITFKKYNNVY